MLKLCPIFILLLIGIHTISYSQSKKSLFRNYVDKEVPQNKFGEILVSKEGKVLVSASEYSFVMITGGNAGSFVFGLDNQDYGDKKFKKRF